MKFGIIVMLSFQKEWLMLERAERHGFFQTVIEPIIENYANKLKVRFFDAEAFNAECSDFLFVECEDLWHYYSFIEQLRDTALFTEPYLKIEKVIMGIENAHKAFDQPQQA